MSRNILELKCPRNNNSHWGDVGLSIENFIWGGERTSAWFSVCTDRSLHRADRHAVRCGPGLPTSQIQLCASNLLAGHFDPHGLQQLNTAHTGQDQSARLLRLPNSGEYTDCTLWWCITQWRKEKHELNIHACSRSLTFIDGYFWNDCRANYMEKETKSEGK